MFLSVLFAVSVADRPLHAATAEEMYSHALAQERALRAPDRTADLPLSDLRTAIALYEEIVRLFPTSDFSDNSLWQASGLALEAYDRFRQPADLATGLRLLELLDGAYPESVLVDRLPERRHQFETVRRPARITTIHRELLDDVVRVTVAFEGEPRFQYAELARPARLFFDIRSTTADPPLRDATLSFDDDVVRQIRLGRHPNQTTRIVLDLADVASYRIHTFYDPFRLVIDCTRGVASPLVATAMPVASLRLPGVTVVGAPADLDETAVSVPSMTARSTPDKADKPGGPIANSDGNFSLARQLGLGVSRVVIDPGHGGHDPGARASGLVEAELVLDIARRLERRLADTGGFEVILTRQSNDYVPLEDRTALANRVGADLFMSIHANASRNHQARGIETYFLNFASDPDAEAQAARENSASGAQMRNLPSIVQAIATNTKRDESHDFARIVQESMVTSGQQLNLDVHDLGVKQAPFVVLIGARMPSILTEVSFLTNPDDARLLASDAYRDSLADALLAGIQRYQAALKNTQTVALQTSPEEEEEEEE